VNRHAALATLDERPPHTALPKQRPTLIMAPDRNAAIAKADERIEVQL
jgi:hypothetical protein